MYIINLVRFIRQPFSTKVKTVVSTFKQINRNYQKAKQPTSYDLKSQVKNDVVIYSLENPNFFIGVNLFSTIQCIVWTYLGIFFFRTIDNPALNFKGNAFWEKVLEKEREFSAGLSAFAIFFGWATLVATCFYSMRSIRKIILHKDGKFVTFVTYNLPGHNTFKVPLNNVSSMEHRMRAKKYIPIKLKNTHFYYLIDIRGEFSNPNLYDFTIGVKRGF